ncbi:MAG: hypothetical protein AMXMBFR77_28120 [Phycisphaerales bacterium]
MPGSTCPDSREHMMRPSNDRPEIRARVERFAARLRALRAERRWTQNALGDRAAVGQGYISLLENGRHRPTCSMVRRLADALVVTPGELDPLDSASRQSEPHRRRLALPAALSRSLHQVARLRGCTPDALAAQAVSALLARCA